MKDTQETIFWGHIVDVVRNRVFDGKIVVKGDKIADIVATEEPLKDVPYILPGFVDSHIHIESSMLLPHNFAQAVVKHGTIACVCDAHEIANVLGREGVEFMIEDGKQCDFYFFNGVPSCVPATSFETSGAELNSEDVEELLKNENITHLSEMMNYPGVISNDEEVIRKIELAHKYNKPIDGHAPMLKGDDLKIYSSYNISTDHECNSIEEAEEKLSNNIKIQIREGSAAKNFDTLLPLVEKYSDRLMFCSDDKHPDDLLHGHINQLVKKAIQKGCPLIDVLKIVSLNPIKHYNLPCGMLQKGDNADFLLINNLEDFDILATYIKGKKVYDSKENPKDSIQQPTKAIEYNNFKAEKIEKKDIAVEYREEKINAIECFNGELFTKRIEIVPKVENGYLVSDKEKDILKIVVLNRYHKAKPSVAFIKGIGLQQGAICSTVAHDSHNIIAVGVEDEDIVEAINLVVKHKGGIAFVNKDDKDILPLPIAGLMANEKIEQVAKNYDRINKKVKIYTNKLNSPYMTLAFMALLVIPEIKISDKGLFDVTRFSFI